MCVQKEKEKEIECIGVRHLTSKHESIILKINHFIN